MDIPAAVRKIASGSEVSGIIGRLAGSFGIDERSGLAWMRPDTAFALEYQYRASVDRGTAKAVIAGLADRGYYFELGRKGVVRGDEEMAEELLGMAESGSYLEFSSGSGRSVKSVTVRHRLGHWYLYASDFRSVSVVNTIVRRDAVPDDEGDSAEVRHESISEDGPGAVYVAGDPPRPSRPPPEADVSDDEKAKPRIDDLRDYIAQDPRLQAERYRQVEYLVGKKRGGGYDRSLAVEKFMSVVSTGAAFYIRDYGTPKGVDGNRLFPRRSRTMLAVEMVRTFEREFAGGQYDEMAESLRGEDEDTAALLEVWSSGEEV